MAKMTEGKKKKKERRVEKRGVLRRVIGSRRHLSTKPPQMQAGSILVERTINQNIEVLLFW